MMKTEEKKDFGADVSRLLEIVAHALYSNRDVFLRELVSNASDACDKLRYEAIAKPDLVKNDSRFRIRVFKNTDERTLTVTDNGIGMSREELIENLGTIAKSGTAALLKEMGNGDAKGGMNLIGQFGVGFYASFMVADRVRVVSAKAGQDGAWLWESDGRTGFSIREAGKKERGVLMNGRGTAVILHIKDEASDYLIDEKLRHVIETWSGHIDFPVYLGEDKNDPEEKPVNDAVALWMRPKESVTKEEHTAFFRHIGFGVDEPLTVSHWRAEGKIEYTALLYVPTLRPMDLYDPTRSHAVRLYVKRVFITDDCQGLIYPWLRFLRGVVDSADLPLNISREMLQHNPLIDKIRSGIGKRILADLNKLAESDPVTYAAFWGQFGAVLKEGLYDAFEHREALLKAARFYSTHEDGALTSLADYVARMKEGQDSIYYISGENLQTLKNSPQLEGFRARGIEVLFFTDTIDDFWLQTVLDYEDKPFQSATKGSIDLDRFEKEKLPEARADEKSAANESDGRSAEALKDALSRILIDEIGQVRVSKRLTESPVCLVAADNEIDLRMERVLRIHQKYEGKSKRVLEINPAHALIKKLSAMAKENPADAALVDAAWLLLDQARIIQGEPIPDPAAFAKRMSAFMARGLAA